MTQSTATAATALAAACAVVAFDNPIARPEGAVEQVRLRKPKAGELRGVQLSALFNMDVMAVAKVVPRISDPALTQDEVLNLEAEDFTSVASEVVGFLLTRAQKASAGLES